MTPQQLFDFFLKEYGHQEGVRSFFAPGRVNLIGEHTDYNGGYVFPAALTFGTWALVSLRKDGIYRFASTNFETKAECRVTETLQYREEYDWVNYPIGILNELLKLAGPEHFTGADVLFHGNIPNGAGLSSSASIELVTGLALSKLAGLEISMIELALLGQRAENHFVGVNCGIMDQFAVAMGKASHAIMLKCDTLEFKYVPVKIDGYKLVITNTNKRRGLTDSKYNERRGECEKGLQAIQAHLPEVRSLGDVNYEMWQEVKEHIKDEVIRRRVEHVITENERVLTAMEKLKKNDLMGFGEMMKESHESLRDLYEVTGIELDSLYEVASQVDGCIGTRMTGAGFGGCNVSLVKSEAVEEFIGKVTKGYQSKVGYEPTFYICEIGDGAKEI
ncbi:galactokinase [Bacillus sp. CECT 9360]|uniref:galactokinase n=1 Tax=Bacillus sp. CECT 9360 TaxID=2845821 RepID=UPI001E48C33B|nr:galactokinase [Bacillus sp. CECT 9360]CAH0345388.1 Galactokinase [Bacillus sp. CECT 9360]